MHYNFEPGERVQVTFETEVICQLPDGKVLLRMVGMPLPITAIIPLPAKAVNHIDPKN